MLLKIFLLILMASFILMIFPINASEMTLKDAVTYALNHSALVDSAKRDVTVKELEQKNHFSTFFPQLDLKLEHGWKTSPNNYENNQLKWHDGMSLTLSENLYDNGVSINRYQLASLELKSSEWSYKKQQNILCLNVATAYLRYNSLTKQQELQQQNYELLKKQYDQIAHDYRSGLKQEQDYLRFKAELYRAEIALLMAKNETSKSLENLKKEMGLEKEESISPLSSSTISFSRDEKLDLNQENISPIDLKTHFDYKLYQLQVEKEGPKINLIKRNYWPQINLNSEVNFNKPDYLSEKTTFYNKNHLNGQAMITLSWNLWDWGERRRNVMISEEQENIERNKMRSSLLELQNEITTLMLDIDLAKRNFILSKTLFELENKNFNFIESEYRNGRLAYLDFIKAISDTLQARRNYFEALYTLKTALMNYRYHQGTLYASFF